MQRLAASTAFILAASTVAHIGCHARHPQLLLTISSEQQCQSRNQKLSNFLRDRLDQVDELVIPRSTDYTVFVEEVKDAMDSHILPDRPIWHIFSDKADFHPSCSGLWLEFGVASGATVNLAAKFRSKHCSSTCPKVIGFDTFTGLPEVWKSHDGAGGTWEQHAFDQGGQQNIYPAVETNVHLVKGLFNESLPSFLGNLSIYAGSDAVVSYLHMDCDLYAGASDALKLLTPYIKVGTVIIFDELVNYQNYRKHEMKALWEWLNASGMKLLPIGMLGPLPGKDYAMELELTGEGPWEHQSAAFVCAYKSDSSVHKRSTH